ncbi:uncharacterized protein [Asterias amurensis]|uniref:uncharacterized protein n=1 Tax=Asterias amurensis TaxID=7602 RepID=UPI003AB66439
MGMLRFLLPLMMCLMACHAVPTIDIPPRESTVRVRGSVTLTCKVMNKGLYVVSWLKQGRVISNDEAIVSSAVESSRYSIVGEPSEGNYSLRITNILLSDNDMFKCQLRAPSGTGFRDVQSRPVTLIVQHPPAEGYPTCYPQYTEIRGLSVGTELKFGCETQIGEPAAQLLWTLNGTELESDVDSATTDFIGMEFRRNITVEDHKKIFLCTLTHELLPGPRTCEVGPLDVLFPPIEAKVESKSTSHKVGSTLLLSCNAKANPLVMPSDYRWYTIPPIDESKQSPLGMVWVLSKLEAGYDGTVVICEARNSMGALNSSFTISVTKETTPPPPPTAPARPTLPRITRPRSTSASANPFGTPYVIILILIAIALLMLAITLVIIAMKRKKQPAAILTVTDLDNLHADVHSLASFGNISRHGTPYLDRVDYELGRSRSHSRDHMFDTDSLDSASALMMRGMSSDSPTHRKYSVDSLGKPLGNHTQYRDHHPRRPSNGSPVHHPSAKRLDSSPVKQRKQSDSALSQAGRPLPKIGPVVEQNEYAELTPVSARKKYNEVSQNSVASPESGYCEDDVLVKNVDNSYSLQSSNNCNCSRKMSHVEV